MTIKKYMFPCLRGAFGKWVTYTCLMQLKDIAQLVNYAKEIHKSKNLSKMIQRALKDEREKEIGSYLIENQERFFNSLVVAIYKGEPQWHEVKAIKPDNEKALKLELPDYVGESMGFLSLTGEEKIFALDGQHRLSGIKFALKNDADLGFEQLPVIFVSHSNDEEGLKRTRRLFTTLNKRAVPVSKDAIIALDEDDVIACVTRYLVEEVSVLGDDRVKFTGTNNVLYSDLKQITTIGNLYDICKILFTEGLLKKKKDLVNFRGTEKDKQELLSYAKDFFESSFKHFNSLKQFNIAKDKALITPKYRNKENGGDLLFRPVGWLLLAKAVCKVHKLKNIEIDKIIIKLSKADLSLEGKVLLNKVWDSDSKNMIKMKAQETKDVIDILSKIARS